MTGEVSTVWLASPGPKDGRDLLHRPGRDPRRGDRQARKLKLIAGMPVEAFIKTGDRSEMSYLTKPMTDQIAPAFRLAAGVVSPRLSVQN
jgi:HlyD family secretion protein